MAAVKAPNQIRSLREFIARPSKELSACLDLIVDAIRKKTWPDRQSDNTNTKMLEIAYKLAESKDPAGIQAGQILVWAEEKRVVQRLTMRKEGVCPDCRRLLIPDSELCHCPD